MDSRFSGTERSIITALAKHYNLRTGECFPAHGRVAVEVGLGSNDTGKKAVQHAVSKAARLGWIKRTPRRGGPREKSQTNTYELTLPQSVRDILNNVGPRLAVTAGEPGTWNVTQTTDGVAICGPFKEREDAEQWIAEHGPTGQIDKATGQNRGTDRTLDPPRTGKSKNREVNRTLSIFDRAILATLGQESLREKKRGIRRGACFILSDSQRRVLGRIHRRRNRVRGGCHRQLLDHVDRRDCGVRPATQTFHHRQRDRSDVPRRTFRPRW
jgi:hypothetical protein